MTFSYHRTYRGPLRAIILDWAGTVLDYGCYAPALVFVEIFQRQGVTVTLAEARGPMGLYKKDHIRQLCQLDSVRQRWQEIHGRLPTEADVEAMYADFVPRQLAVLAAYAELIPGTLEAVAACRQRGLKIGSTTGYTTEMMAIVRSSAERHGYAPDAIVCADEVPTSRPAPWMCVQNAMQLGIYPFAACVKVDDTAPGIEEGLNAGMWTIGLAQTGNEVGLNEAEITQLDAATLRAKVDHASNRLWQSGAHYVVNGIWAVPAVLDAINARLARGEKP